MAVPKIPSPSRLRQLLRVDRATGKLYWRERAPDLFSSDSKHGPEWDCKKWNAQWAGREAFTARSGRYLCGSVEYYHTYAHRVIVAMENDAWPKEVDHINGNCRDNRPENLRACNAAENRRNVAIGSNNRSGVVGVSWQKGCRRWVAQIKLNGKNVYLGQFVNKEDAVARRKQAERDAGFSSGHGRTKIA